MQDPTRDIIPVIHALCETSSPAKQRATVENYFLINAEFDHPLCKVASILPSHGLSGSQDLILGVYRWYKILFKEVNVNVNGVAWNPDLQRLYIEIQQTCTYRILPIPGRSVPVKFVTVIDVQKGRHQKIHMRNTSVEVDDVTEPEDGDDLWYIKKQNDLYQTDQWFNFLMPGGTLVIDAAKLAVGVGCTMGSMIAGSVVTG